MNNEQIFRYFEQKATFSYLVNLVTNEKSRYVVFKPMITVSSSNKDMLEKLNTLFNNETKLYRYSNSDLYYLKIQNHTEIENVLAYISKQSFESTYAENNSKIFLELYNKTKIVGFIHSEYSDKFEELLLMKNQLNTTTRFRKALTPRQWSNRIEQHLTY